MGVSQLYPLFSLYPFSPFDSASAEHIQPNAAPSSPLFFRIARRDKERSKPIDTRLFTFGISTECAMGVPSAQLNVRSPAAAAAAAASGAAAAAAVFKTRCKEKGNRHPMCSRPLMYGFRNRTLGKKMKGGRRSILGLGARRQLIMQCCS